MTMPEGCLNDALKAALTWIGMNLDLGMKILYQGIALAMPFARSRRRL